eukprot:m.45100 g.45100  ORF g.45100 m.45100 type:complete len:116 (+) comp33564_c0_seq7:309-656(+)
MIGIQSRWIYIMKRFDQLLSLCWKDTMVTADLNSKTFFLFRSGTIFAYGQTGTGKTFTMEGIRSDVEQRGVIPNSFDHVFTHIARSHDQARALIPFIGTLADVLSFSNIWCERLI